MLYLLVTQPVFSLDFNFLEARTMSYSFLYFQSPICVEQILGISFCKNCLHNKISLLQAWFQCCFLWGTFAYQSHQNTIPPSSELL